jgi:hypothetical protein
MTPTRMPYFKRLDEHRFLATKEVSGAWDIEQQHIAPALGLLAHAVERITTDGHDVLSR